MTRLAGACVLLSAAATAAAVAGAAQGSQLLDRGARGVRLAVDAHGHALVTYEAGGKQKRVLAWGAVDAVAPARSARQAEFSLDYSGGWKELGPASRSFANACKPYSGPKLAFFVAGCTASDGSLWALQAWPRGLPNSGVAATPAQAAPELRLSHWTGPLPVLTVGLGWTRSGHGYLDRLFGTLTYRSHGVFGFATTRDGVPVDDFGRVVYVDAYDSPLGKGWRRENSFVTQRPGGDFCEDVGPHGGHPAGRGKRYRVTVSGPGVTPDVSWQGNGPGAYEEAKAAAALAAERRLLAGSACAPR